MNQSPLYEDETRWGGAKAHLNPDNWVIKPEFDVKPYKTDAQGNCELNRGFEAPIYGPFVEWEEEADEVRRVTSKLYSVIKAKFKTIKAFNKCCEEVQTEIVSAKKRRHVAFKKFKDEILSSWNPETRGIRAPEAVKFLLNFTENTPEEAKSFRVPGDIEVEDLIHGWFREWIEDIPELLPNLTPHQVVAQKCNEALGHLMIAVTSSRDKGMTFFEKARALTFDFLPEGNGNSPDPARDKAILQMLKKQSVSKTALAFGLSRKRIQQIRDAYDGGVRPSHL